MTTVPVITIDGPSGAGKGTLCKTLAEKLKWNLLDSGAIYRVLALAALHHQIELTAEEALAPVAAHLDVRFLAETTRRRVILEGEDVTQAIRTQRVSDTASRIATFPRVREALLRRQRAFREAPGLIADGRDMGTFVFPEAAVKIFLDASADERAQRRFLQLQEMGNDVKFERILNEIEQRDERDRNRTVSPLKAASNALLIDSTGLSLDQVVEQTFAYITQVLPELTVQL